MLQNSKYLIFLFILVSKVAFSSDGSDQGFYKTPVKVKNPFESNPISFTSPERVAIQVIALNLPDTPFDKSSKRHRRELIDKAPTPKRKAAARYNRYVKGKGVSSHKKRRQSFYGRWHVKYETILNNSGMGRIVEEKSTSEFGLSSNNLGEVESFTIVLSPFRGRTITHTTRPDAMGEDEDGNTVVFEVKYLKNKDAVLYVSSQLRAQEKVARNKDGRHVISMNTCLDFSDFDSFPRPSSGFYHRGMITEFRLCDGDGTMYRWDWESNDGEWIQVVEKSLAF